MLKKTSAVVCVMAWLLGGCGGAVQDEAAVEEVGSTEQPIIWICEPTDRWVRTWYTNSSRTTRTGYEFCCDGVLTQQGTRSNYYTQQSYSTCGLPEA